MKRFRVDVDQDAFYAAIKGVDEPEFTTFALPRGWRWCSDPSCPLTATEPRHAHPTGVANAVAEPAPRAVEGAPDPAERGDNNGH